MRTVPWMSTSDRRFQRAKKPTGCRRSPARAGTPSCGYTVRSNHGSTRLGGRERWSRCSYSAVGLLVSQFPLLCRFSDAGMTRLSTRCGDRRPKSANARSRGSMAPGSAASAMGIVCWWRSRWWTRREQNACTTFAFWHERCTRGFLMFLARVISNGCAWQKQHIPQPLRD
jgi:hypothetical protein